MVIVRIALTTCLFISFASCSQLVIDLPVGTILPVAVAQPVGVEYQQQAHYAAVPAQAAHAYQPSNNAYNASAPLYQQHQNPPAYAPQNSAYAPQNSGMPVSCDYLSLTLRFVSSLILIVHLNCSFSCFVSLSGRLWLCTIM